MLENKIIVLIILSTFSINACGELDENELSTPIDEKYVNFEDNAEDLSTSARTIELGETKRISVRQGRHKRYRFTKQAGTDYIIILSNLSEDLDLFTHWESGVKFSNYQFRSDNGWTQEEKIEIEASQNGDYFIAVYGYASGTADLTVYENGEISNVPCTNACMAFGSDCGLPCNNEVPGYNCPIKESDINLDMCEDSTNIDDGNFEHHGTCYRCDDGQQCCYENGLDNGSGSFDLEPPGWGGLNIIAHCACDVISLCGCMAQSGRSDLCATCIGTSITPWDECNAPGPDSTFCTRAREASYNGFDWCGIMGDVNTCSDRPSGW